MKLIQNIYIENFRSIQNQVISDAGALNGTVGKNSSGKSNALRALNLFFNGEVEPGKRVDFARDHYQQIPRKRKKKRISISVDFSLPPNFNLRRGLVQLQKLSTDFRITRYWELDQFRKPRELQDETDPEWGGGIPATFLFDERGKLVFSHAGALDFGVFDKELERHGVK